MNLLDQPLGQIARSIAGAPAALLELRLDFYADGDCTLREALAKQGIDETAATRALQQLTEQNPATATWQSRTTEELVEHILSRYHDVHRKQLPDLIRLAQRVERVHGSHPQSPAGLAALLEKMHQDLEAHMQKEETILFPMILRRIAGFAAHPVSVMRRDHDDHAAAIEEIDRLTGGLIIPEGACNSWRTLYRGLDDLKADLKAHIELENDVLFARLAAPQEGVGHRQGGGHHGHGGVRHGQGGLRHE